MYIFKNPGKSWLACGPFVSPKLLFLDDMLRVLSFDPLRLLADNPKKSCFRFSPDLVPILPDTKNFPDQWCQGSLLPHGTPSLEDPGRSPVCCSSSTTVIWIWAWEAPLLPGLVSKSVLWTSTGVLSISSPSMYTVSTSGWASTPS